MGTRISQNTASSLAFSCASLNFNSCTLLTTSLLVFQFHTYLSVTLWFSLLNHLEIKVTSFILYLTSLCRIFYRLARVFTLLALIYSTHERKGGERTLYPSCLI